MRIRQVPKLDFRLDPGIVAGQRIEEILRDIHQPADEKDEASTAGGNEEKP
jgi:ribosome-binding factor A